MAKIDFKKELSFLYGAKKDKFEVVEVPKLSYLMIDGKGNPNTSQEYIDAIQTLYPVAFTLKFMIKKANPDKDYAVMPLEGLWWSDDMSDFATGNKDNWKWTAMMMQPDFVTKELFEEAVEQVKQKKSPASISKIRLEEYDEGRAAQVLYVGPYADETETIQKLHSFIEENGGKFDESNLHHHEIYLSDPRRTDPTKLRTIIRQPF